MNRSQTPNILAILRADFGAVEVVRIAEFEVDSALRAHILLCL